MRCAPFGVRREYAATDDQLERAIREVTEELRRHPWTLPPVPPYPKR